jgi:hypothetical protein
LDRIITITKPLPAFIAPAIILNGQFIIVHCFLLISSKQKILNKIQAPIQLLLYEGTDGLLRKTFILLKFCTIFRSGAPHRLQRP